MTPSTPDVSRPGPTGVAGLHHVAVVSRDLARSADFYGRILGLSDVGLGPVPVTPMERPGRLEEATGRWYGDATGRPGSLVAVIERPDAPEGHPGIGGSHHRWSINDHYIVRLSHASHHRSEAVGLQKQLWVAPLRNSRKEMSTGACIHLNGGGQRNSTLYDVADMRGVSSSERGGDARTVKVCIDDEGALPDERQ